MTSLLGIAARVLLAHVLGFNTIYAENQGAANEVNYWTSHITGTTFDPGGLNVTLAAADNLTHLANSGATAGYLMTASLVNGDRRDIASLELDMLSLSLGYTIVPEPVSSLGCALVLGLVVVVRRMHRR